jgi:thioesterase domain-containing protein/SAM-dependent methyltransferase
VRDCVVVAREDGLGDKRLVAYVVPSNRQSVENTSGRAGPDVGEQLSTWRRVWEGQYEEDAPDATFDTAGWKSSYTGDGIPAEEVRESVERTTERLMPLCGEHVLEIGCGTGLLVSRIAPRCTSFVGTDFSAKALDRLRSSLGPRGYPVPQLTLLEREADDFSGFERGQFDTVILNSIIQYFPNVDYLLRVLKGALGVVRPGGVIFLGDVRSLPLLEAFHASVQLERSATTLAITEWRQRVRRALREDKELVIDPRFFTALMHQYSTITDARVELKRGRYHNELSRFRYDVTICVGQTHSAAPESVTLNWETAGLSLAELREMIGRDHPQVLRVTGVRNARLDDPVGAERFLHESEPGIDTVGDLRAKLSKAQTSGSVDPEEFWKLGDELSYKVMVETSEGGGDGRFEVIFARAGIALPRRARPSHDDTSLPLRAFAQEPSSASIAAGQQTQLPIDDLRHFLSQKLPEYMIPSAYVVVETLPLSPSGKVDRRALPVPDATQLRSDSPYIAPRDEIEARVESLWQRVFGFGPIGVHDDFFELGGHSLLIVRLANQIAENFSQDRPLNFFFQHRTIEQMAAALRDHVEANPSTVDPADATVADTTSLPFFCLSMGPLIASVLDDIPVYSLGSFYDDLRYHSSIEEIAAANIERMRAIQKKGPYRISGFCGMALVAFEMAQILRAQGEEVSQLIMIEPTDVPLDRSGPQSWLRYYVARMVYHLSKVAKIHPKSWLTYCHRRLRTVGRRIFATSMELVQHDEKVDVLTRMERAALAHVPSFYPGRATLLVASDRVEESGGQTAFGWDGVIGGGLEARIVPGNHETLFDEQHMPIMAGELRNVLHLQ